MLEGASSRFSRCLRQVDDVRAGDGAQLGDAAQAGECNKLLDIDLVRLAGFGVGEVGEPFELGGNVGEVAELGRGERAPQRRDTGVGDSHQLLFHPPPLPIV